MKITHFLTAADAARVLDVTPATIRAMERRGVLPVAAMTEGGIHLFRRAAVERLARRRTKRKQQAERAVGGGRGDAP